MPAKRTEPKAKPTRKAAARRRRATAVGHDEIAVRAYFISLEGGHDPFENWLRAERELQAA